jgi:hypothetical protein
LFQIISYIFRLFSVKISGKESIIETNQDSKDRYTLERDDNTQEALLKQHLYITLRTTLSKKSQQALSGIIVQPNYSL